jgi:hypothetical protein
MIAASEGELSVMLRLHESSSEHFYGTPLSDAAGEPGPPPAQHTVSSSDKSLLRDPGLTNRLRHRNADLGLLQNGYDLLHRITLPLHGKSPFLGVLILPETHSQTGSKIPEPLHQSLFASLGTCEVTLLKTNSRSKFLKALIPVPAKPLNKTNEAPRSEAG